MKIAICACAKYEEKYMKEWIDHHLQIGVDDIYIYDNNDDDKQKEIIDQYSDHVYRINIRGQKAFQIRIYNDFYNTVGNMYDYIIFIDLDEFIIFNPNQPIQNIKDFLQLNPDHKYYRICQQCRVNNELITYDDRPLKERFTEVWDVEQDFPKTIVATNMNIKMDIHNAICNITCYNGDNEIVSNSMKDRNIKQNYNCLYFAHYINKTPEEYFNTKYQRGYDACGLYSVYGLEWYYIRNKLTKESFDYLCNKFNVKEQSKTSLWNKIKQTSRNNKWITIEQANKISK